MSVADGSAMRSRGAMSWLRRSRRLRGRVSMLRAAAAPPVAVAAAGRIALAAALAVAAIVVDHGAARCAARSSRAAAAGRLIVRLQRFHRFRPVGLVPVAARHRPAGAAVLDSPAMPRFSRGCWRPSRFGSASCFSRSRCPACLHHRQAADRAGAALRRRRRRLGLCAVHLAGPLRQLSLRPCHHGFCRAGRHRRDVSAGEGADVDLCRADRAEPGGVHGASSERRDRRRHCRRGGRPSGAQLVCRPPARICGWTPMVRCCRCPGPALRASSKRLPAGCTLPRTRP